MARSQMAVNETRAVTDEYNWQQIVRDVELDLLDHPQRHESTESVYERPETQARQSSRQPDHVLLRYSCIDVLGRANPSELIEQCVPVVPCQQKHIGID